MKKNNYNVSEDKYQHVIKLLKELPKVKAADNFEFNLMLKIQNKNFELNKPEKSFLSTWKIFVPASAVIAIYLLFFFFYNSEDNQDNPFQLIPKMRTELSSNFNNSLNIFNNNFEKEISNKDVIINKSSSDKNISNNITNKNSSSTAKTEKEINFPFDISTSTNIDEILVSKRSETNIDKRATLAGKNNSSFFDGFFIREEVDQRYIEEMRARFDSLKKNLNMPKNIQK